MNQDSWHHTAETAASRTLLTAAITGLCSWFANSLRLRLERRQEQRAMAASVAAVREVVDPSSPDKPDLGSRVDAIQNELRAQQDATIRLTERLDTNIQQQQERHTELCTLILQSRK